jgi:formylglycine-generating enzyme
MNVMHVNFCFAAVCVIALSISSAARGINIETVLVSDVGNVADSRFMNDGTTGYGSVSYEYRIGKYEVTNDEFAAFLNAVARNGDTHAIFEPFFMGTAYYGGIERSGGAPNSIYTVKPNMGNKPVNGVTAGAARRFANWLNNGQPNGNQLPGITETGAYDLTGENWQSRSPGATWFIPTEDEWYKAAYYNPTGGPSGFYSLYATGSLAQPTAAQADAVGNVSNPGVNVANYEQAANWNNSAPFGNVTTVGSAGPLSVSFYGTFDQSGNLSEHAENISVRGGGWNSLQDAISAGVRFGNSFGAYAGLRVASVLDPPDPDDLPGDFDFDGDVDGRDFLLWQRGSSPSPLSGSDLADWQANYSVGPLTAANVAVPEPCAWVLAILTVFVGGFTRGSRLDLSTCRRYFPARLPRVS